MVTGAGGGIGSAVAIALAHAGYSLVINDRRAASLAAVAERVDPAVEVTHVVGDVDDPELHQELVDAAGALGGLAVSVLVAGIYLPGLVWETPLEHWELQMDVDFWGVLHGVRAAVPTMIERGAGHVVAVASGAGVVATPALGPYVAAKHAVVGMMESLHHELARVAPQVHASVVCPGNIRTPMAANSLAAAGIHDEQLSGTVADVAATVRAGNDAGADPEVVAAAVLAAIEENRFWVLPQPEVGLGALDRVQRMSSGRPPVDLLR